MKLFVWVTPYRVWYGDSLCVVAAETVEQAREVARKSPTYEYGLNKRSDGDNPVELGEPTRVLDLPGGEWHEWSE